MEALLLDETWNPASSLVELNQAFLNLSNLDEPAIETSVNERCVTAPAEGITMLHGTACKKSSLGLEVLNDSLISIFDVNSSVG